MLLALAYAKVSISGEPAKTRDNRLTISRYADDFERPTLRGCTFATIFGRVVASLQRLPCQKTKPKGLWCRGGLWWFGFICVFTRLLADNLNDQP